MDWFRNLFSSNKVSEKMELEDLDSNTSQCNINSLDNQGTLQSNNSHQTSEHILGTRKASTSLQPSLLTKLRNYFSEIDRPHEVILGTIELAALITAVVGSIISCTIVVMAAAIILIGIACLSQIINYIAPNH